MKGTARLPAAAMDALADLVAAGYGLAEALEALPRQSLKPKLVRQIDSEVAELHTGGGLDVALERLGLGITAVVIRGSQTRTGELETALRADAEAQSTEDEALRKIRYGVKLFAIIVAGLALVVLFVSLVLVPHMLKGLPGPAEGEEMPMALVRFEQFRNLWLGLGGGFVLAVIALTVIFAGVLGREGWILFLQDLRLLLPFLRAHAIHASSARLLEALAHEQAAGIPANETVRRVTQREPVPRLRDSQTLAALRLEAGDPWEVCLRGTLLDTPVLADLASLAGRGARPMRGWRWAAARNRELAVKGLQRAIIAAAALVLIPAFLYLLVLMHVSFVTVTIAQFEGVQQEIQQLTTEVDKILKKGR